MQPKVISDLLNESVIESFTKIIHLKTLKISERKQVAVFMNESLNPSIN